MMVDDTLRCSRVTGKLAATLLLLWVAGCSVSPTVTVSVDAIRAEVAASDARYWLKPVVDGVDDADLHYLEFAEHIHTALETQGLHRAPTVEQAGIEIEVNYGALPDQRMVVVPGFRSRPYRTHRYCGNRDDSGHCRLWQTRRFTDRWDVFDRYYRHDVRVLSYYRVFLTLEAFDKNVVAAKRDALWATRARIISAGSDLRTAIPVLVAASTDYIGKDTGHEVAVVLPRDD